MSYATALTILSNRTNPSPVRYRHAIHALVQWGDRTGTSLSLASATMWVSGQAWYRVRHCLETNKQK